jgi:hypothetical protein
MTVEYLANAVGWHDHFITVEDRAQQMREAGASSRIYERKHPGAQVWRRRSGRIAEAARIILERLAGLRSAATGRQEHQWAYYARLMDRQLARGYFDGQAQWRSVNASMDGRPALEGSTDRYCGQAQVPGAALEPERASAARARGHERPMQ